MSDNASRMGLFCHFVDAGELLDSRAAASPDDLNMAYGDGRYALPMANR